MDLSQQPRFSLLGGVAPLLPQPTEHSLMSNGGGGFRFIESFCLHFLTNNFILPSPIAGRRRSRRLAYFTLTLLCQLFHSMKAPCQSPSKLNS